MIILGINAYHPDSSACLLVDGKIKIALEEERINRVKHWSGLPILAIKKCLESQKIRISDIDFVAINANFFSNFFSKIKYILLKRPNIFFLTDKIRNRNKKNNILDLLTFEFNGENFNKNCKIISVDHHLSHLSSAFFDSPFTESINVSVDGFGDFTSMSWGIGNKSGIKIDERILFPDSLGIFYEAFTQYLGFENYGDEYKVMGLSSYGKPTELTKIKKIIYQRSDCKFNLNLDYFNHHKKDIVYGWQNSQPKQKTLFNDKIFDLFGKSRKKKEPMSEQHKNIAASVQKTYEDILFNILNNVYKKYKIKSLTLSGGCAQNSLANGKIISNTQFNSLFIPSNAGDAGGAIGASYYAWYKLKKSRPYPNLDPYLGTSYSNQYIENLINKRRSIFDKNKFNFFFLEEDSLCEYAANAIAKSKVLGWFQGKMEWGPRALGNRSILADPRNPEMRNILNTKIKKRESFRPFAPSILLDEVENWFEDFIGEEPFMSRVLKFKSDKINKIPAVAHVDGSGRIHTVKQETNLRYFKLITYFKKITGVPIVLNTSFNENEPIVYRPEEAIDCFERTKMDSIILENWVITR
jgi:carbamoyltransferase